MPMNLAEERIDSVVVRERQVDVYLGSVSHILVFPTLAKCIKHVYRCKTKMVVAAAVAIEYDMLTA